MPPREAFEGLPGAGTDWVAREAGAGIPDAGGFSTPRQMLFPRELPAAEALCDTDLITLLNEIEIEFLQQGYRLDFLDRVPPRAAYRGLLRLLDSPLPQPKPDEEGFELVSVDGCDSACEVCFQLAYCPVAKEVLGLEWRHALEQAGANPSWAALYAADPGFPG